MFTTKSQRNTLAINTATKLIGPGQYNIDKSTLKPLCKPYKHEQLQEKITDTGMLAQQIKQSSKVPPVGVYDITAEPKYIRGARKTTASFADEEDRFYVRNNDFPGPGEYYNETFVIKTQKIIPESEKYEIPENQRFASIPKTLKKPPEEVKNLISDPRATWITKSQAGGALGGPSPLDHAHLDTHLDHVKADVKVIPVGGLGGSALLKIDRESPWANAPERPGVHVEHQNGPLEYSRTFQGGVSVKNPEKGSACMMTDENERFKYQLNGKDLKALQMPYYTPDKSIEGRFQSDSTLKRQIQEMKKEKQEREEITQILHPSIGPAQVYREEKPYISYLSDVEKHTLNNVPSVGSYVLQRTLEDPGKKLSVEAQARMALARYYQIPKGEFQRPSIPNLRRDVEERPEMIKQLPKSVLALTSLRNVDKLPKTNWDVGPASYFRKIKPRDEITIKNLQKAPGHDLYQDLRVTERNEILREQSRRRFIEEQQLARQVGGEATMINYQLAKTNPEEQYDVSGVFGSTDKGRLDKSVPFSDTEQLLNNPHVGAYELQQVYTHKIQPQINTSTRVISTHPRYGVSDAVSNQQSAQIIAKDISLDHARFPGLYQGECSKKAALKKSFNATCDENIIQQ